ncbi:unnamed protein product [Rangifer tarandus platyrhynchus]|uniref:Uncharacterized protein n=2 Tax=Rangifer tarandus platyrhynchus TaxID=3082113 RepID=A0ABN9A1H3_RANTA|nr:unnamed protein product [Rangifer tarandus platyrhynchus]
MEASLRPRESWGRRATPGAAVISWFQLIDSAFGEDILVLFHLGEVNCRPSFLFLNLSPSCREKVSDMNVSMGSTALSQKTFRYPGGLPVAHRWTVHTAINGSIPGPRNWANKLTCSGFVTRKSE